MLSISSNIRYIGGMCAGASPRVGLWAGSRFLWVYDTTTSSDSRWPHALRVAAPDEYNLELIVSNSDASLSFQRGRETF
jgi:hypothetical protein